MTKQSLVFEKIDPLTVKSEVASLQKTPRNDKNRLLDQVLSLRAERSNLLFWTLLKFDII